MRWRQTDRQTEGHSSRGLNKSRYCIGELTTLLLSYDELTCSKTTFF